jgi:hypothetical protein
MHVNPKPDSEKWSRFCEEIYRVWASDQQVAKIRISLMSPAASRGLPGALTDSRAGVRYEHVFLPPKLVVRGSTIKIAPMSSSRPNHHHFKSCRGTAFNGRSNKGLQSLQRCLPPLETTDIKKTPHAQSEAQNLAARSTGCAWTKSS